MHVPPFQPWGWACVLSGDSGKNTQEETFHFMPHLSRVYQNVDSNDHTLDMFLALCWTESTPN